MTNFLVNLDANFFIEALDYSLPIYVATLAVGFKATRDEVGNKKDCAFSFSYMHAPDAVCKFQPITYNDQLSNGIRTHPSGKPSQKIK